MPARRKQHARGGAAARWPTCSHSRSAARRCAPVGEGSEKVRREGSSTAPSCEAVRAGAAGRAACLGELADPPTVVVAVHARRREVAHPPQPPVRAAARALHLLSVQREERVAVEVGDRRHGREEVCRIGELGQARLSQARVLLVQIKGVHRRQPSRGCNLAGARG